MTTETDRTWFNTAQAAAYTGYHATTIRGALESGELEGTQRIKNGRWRMHKDWLDAWLKGEAA